MRRQRGELVPIAEALADLPGPVKALRRDRPPQRGFTLVDQVNRLVGASEADPDRGFMARMMALCSLPRSNPGNRHQYKRVNGPYKLVMTAIGDKKLPFGTNPRLILAWVCTEAVRTQSRDIVLGRSLSEFMRTLGISSTDGRGQARLRNQMERLFSCSISMIYKDDNLRASAFAVLADLTVFWWNPKQPDQTGLWESKVRLSESFFNEIVSHPVPARFHHPQGPQTLSVGPRSLLVAGLPHLPAPRRATDHMAADLPPVRSGPGRGWSRDKFTTARCDSPLKSAVQIVCSFGSRR